MNDHANTQNEENAKRIAQLTRKVEGLKERNRALRIYAMKLKSLAEEYMPRGLEVPVQDPGDGDEVEQEEIMRLNQRVR